MSERQRSSGIRAVLVGAALAAAAPFARAEDGAPALQPLSPAVSPDWAWKERLGLTDAQSRDYSSAVKSRSDALRPLRERLSAALEKIRTLVAAKADDKDVAGALGEVDRVRGGMAAADKEFDADLASFLTPTQRAMLLIGAPRTDAAIHEASHERTLDIRDASADEDLDAE